MSSKLLFAALMLIAAAAVGTQAIAVHAQTSTPSSTPTPAPTSSPTPVATPTPVVTTPGVPNTGAGGDAPTNIFVLAASALVITLGAAYLYRNRKTS